MSNKKIGDLSNISDILIVRKITEKSPLSHIPYEASYEDIARDSGNENERELLAEEHEVIVRKQLQMLQADERGKQALIQEIAAIKQKQEKRAEVIKSRQHALEIEKERARRIASLPPPLPKSVKLLLRKCDEPKPSKPDVQMPEELKTVAITPVAFDEDEDKENIVNPEEMKAKKKMQEEWNLKARKRFNEALKKDRQKGEYANTMKQIKSAEMQNRREMAKNISSEKSITVPCPLSDKFQAAKNQIDMEDTAEKWFKKNTKEHVIEEIEGYQDYYETKYKRIDSEFESKMIDCVPSFVKENYEYLLEDESKFLGGKNFSGLNDSGSNLLNEAFIETPPHEEGGGKIDFVIDHLDKLRSMLQTEYDQTLKPLLVASMEVPLKALSDKSVETDFFKQPGEDKAVETDKPIEGHLTPPFSNSLQRPRIFYKRRREPFLPPFSEYTIPDMHHRDVHYPFPAAPLSEGLGATSWSSSSYCSLPSKHGFPNVPGSTEYCDICAAERENKLIEDEFPRRSSTLSNGMQIDSSTNKSFKTSEKIDLSGYVQQLAKKYLEPKSVSSGDLQEEDDSKSFRDCLASEKAISEKISPAFVKEKIGKSIVDSPEVVPHKLTKMSPILETLGYSGPVLHDSDKTGNAFSKINEEKGGYVGSKKSEKYEIPNYVFDNNEAKSHEDSNNYSEYEAEVKRLQLIQQVLSRRIPLLNFNDSPKPVNQVNTEQTDLHASSFADARREMPCKPHVYHELSTIHEADSALATSSLHLSQSGLSAEKTDKEKSVAEQLENSIENMKIISLLDPPDSKISELAKSIHFVAKSPEKAAQPFKVSKSLPFESPVVAVSSNESITPSHISLSSASPSFPNGKMYSSSLTENHVKYPHLKSTETLSRYFKDISGIQQKTISSSESTLISSAPSLVTLSSFNSPSTTSVPSIIDTQIKASSDEPSASHPLVSGFISDRKTPCTNDSDSNQEPSTNHPLVSGFISDMKAPDVSNPDSFHPMTPHSDISSLSVKKSSATEFNKYDIDNNQIVTSNVEPFMYEHASSPESDVFKPMTPHSNISSPNTISNTPKSKQQIHADSSAESFKLMSPKSMISSPSLPSDDSSFKGENTLMGSSRFKPATFRFTIPVPLPISSSETNVKKSKIKKMPELQLGSKSQVSKHPDYWQIAKGPGKEVKSTCVSNDEGKAYHDRQSTNQGQKNVYGEVRSKHLSRICSSNFFVPHIYASDAASPQTKCQDFDLIEGSLTKSSQKEEQLQTNSDSEPSKASSCSNGRSHEKFSDLKCPSEGSVKKLDSLDACLKKQYASLQAISSTSSSSENLSDMFSGSKIVYQSTPIKSVEELAQEKGILEEPDLTLVTQITGMLDSLELPRDLSSDPANPAPINMNLEKDITLLTSPKTPTNISPKLPASFDTPSMISFLHHEMICLQEENSSIKDENCSSEAPKTQKVQKNQKFPRVEYKERTKRLWNNLEEVKKRNLAEEQRKVLSVNRLKAKEYAKKLTPKRKAN